MKAEDPITTLANVTNQENTISSADSKTPCVETVDKFTDAEPIRYSTSGRMLHYCPYCGKSYYMIDHSERTAVYYPPIIKDGVNINPDRNESTVHCTCQECGKRFTYKE